VIKQNILAKDLIPNVLLFVDDQLIVSNAEYELQRAAYTLNNISQRKRLQGKMNVRTKTVINKNISEQVTSSNYLRYTITVSNNSYLEIKMNRYNQMCSTRRKNIAQQYKKRDKDENL
jgi:hypothetical protein